MQCFVGFYADFQGGNGAAVGGNDDAANGNGVIVAANDDAADANNDAANTNDGSVAANRIAADGNYFIVAVNNRFAVGLNSPVRRKKTVNKAKSRLFGRICGTRQLCFPSPNQIFRKKITAG